MAPERYCMVAGGTDFDGFSGHAWRFSWDQRGIVGSEDIAATLPQLDGELEVVTVISLIFSPRDVLTRSR